MKLISALKILQQTNVPVITTADAAYKLGLTNEHASQVLRRLAAEKHIAHLSRGLWVIDLQVNPLLLPEYLGAPLPSYISLQTALYHHGMINQIPRMITAITLKRTHHIKTPLASFSMHHVSPDFFCDYEVDERTQVKMATPEKALLDIFYLSPTKSLWFKSLPEVELPKGFNIKKAFALIQKIPSKSRRTLMETSLNSMLKKNRKDK